MGLQLSIVPPIALSALRMPSSSIEFKERLKLLRAVPEHSTVDQSQERHVTPRAQRRKSIVAECLQFRNAHALQELVLNSINPGELSCSHMVYCRSVPLYIRQDLRFIEVNHFDHSEKTVCPQQRP